MALLYPQQPEHLLCLLHAQVNHVEDWPCINPWQAMQIKFRMAEEMLRLLSVEQGHLLFRKNIDDSNIGLKCNLPHYA